MDTLGLSPADFNTYLRTLTTDGHRRLIDLDVLDLADGSHMGSLSHKILDGQITFDVTADVTRVLTLTIADPKNTLGFEPNDPSDAPLHRSRELRVTDRRWVDEFADWVSCRVFTGPMQDFTRQGGQVDLVAHGRERQALGQLWQTMHFPKKSKVTDAIRRLLAAVGDVNAHVPDLPNTLPHDLNVHPLDSAWPHVKHLAASLDRYVFYDGSGRFQIRPHGQRPVYRFHRSLLSDVKIGRPIDGFFNTALVIGPKPHGPKKRVKGSASLGDPNPKAKKKTPKKPQVNKGRATLAGTLSPEDLNRNGVPFHLVKSVTLQHAKTSAQCQRIAERLILEHATVRTDLSWDAMPNPTLEEYDMAAVTDDAFGTARSRMRQWVYPLTGGDAGGTQGPPMSVGTTKRITKARVRK